MKYLSPALFLCAAVLAAPAQAQNEQVPSSGEQPFIEAVTVEGAPIASHHFQSGDNNFHQRHTLGILKVETNGYGNWGLYVLTPNSVRNTSIGAGYVTDPYVIPVYGDMHLDLSGAIGLVTGYQDYPVPLLAGEARFVAYEEGPWSAGISMAALPYIMTEDNNDGDDKTKFGVVATTPFLSVRYKFN